MKGKKKGGKGMRHDMDHAVESTGDRSSVGGQYGRPKGPIQEAAGLSKKSSRAHGGKRRAGHDKMGGY